MQPGSLYNKDMLRDGYWPKMLLYALDELFYVFNQVKLQRGMDEKIIVAYKILCLSVLQCTEQQHGSERKGMPDALSLLNVNDTHHLEHLVWMVYDGALLVGEWPKLPGNHPWCTVLAGLYKHIYRVRKDAAHCSPYKLASWDCQERVEVLRQEGRPSSTWSGQQRASRPRRRSRSSSQCCYQTLAQGDWSRHFRDSSPNTPSRCHCGAPLSPDADTMPKLASAVNVPSYAPFSHSSRGMAWASLDDEDAWEDGFQTPHRPVCCIVWMGVATENRQQRGWKPPGEAPAGSHITKWILVVRRRRLNPLILIGGPLTGSNWRSRALQKTKCPGMC